MKLTVLLTGILFPCVVLGANVGDRTVLIKSNDPEMAAAISKAQATLDHFLEIAAKPPKGSSDFKLKVRISEPQGTEHLWVTPFEPRGSHFVGTVADVPEIVKSVRYGQVITFSRSQISDWGYVQDGKQIGSFTVCVVFEHMPPDEVEKYRKQYGFQCY